jgi:hypothetical protein
MQAMEKNFKEVSVKANLFKEVNVFINDAKLDDSSVLRVVKDQKVTGEDEATYAKLIGSEFQDGVIEVQVFLILTLNIFIHEKQILANMKVMPILA